MMLLQQYSEPDWFARALGTLGLAVALASLAWTVRKDRKDRGQIKATAELRGNEGNGYPGLHLSRDEVLSGKHQKVIPYLRIHAVNTGRRTVQIVAIHGRRRLPRWWGSVELHTWPKVTLNESDPAELDIEIVTGLYAWRTVALKDSTGRLWNVSRRDYKNALKEVRENGLIGSVRPGNLK